ncbi:pyridoxal phosphate-dependent decarboxylase family protein [Planctomicrobium sp. SH527]|uniref:pyridoxal phosphate-dependent decarboxylase family protein n=1 Tax=Planctomicrobium sp. SH527 TaxID=3448123 RepID=UPI003F5C2E56
MLTPEHLALLKSAIGRLEEGFRTLPSIEQNDLPADVIAGILTATADRLHNNFPYQHPFYLGQMLKPPHPVAHLAYALAMCINPNNHAMDGGRASSEMEFECIDQIAQMFGWETHIGHLCGGGTMANFEALWIARELTGGKGVAASEQAHYTHSRLTDVLQVPFYSIPVDSNGKMNLSALEDLLKQDLIGTVVATLGTTGIGAVDPLTRLVELKKKYDFRLHVDSAYGGYFRLVSNLRVDTSEEFAAMSDVDSIVIDPHKHGLQPYGCGCVLFKDPRIAAIYKHESPYTYFTSSDLHLGEISLECSRPGASAVALWATMQAFPLQFGGAFAQRLEKSRLAALTLHQWIQRQPEFTAIADPELDIVVWTVNADTASQASKLAQQIFNAAAEEQVHLALLSLSQQFAMCHTRIQHWDRPDVTCLRATVMKPEHLDVMPEILNRLESACRRVLSAY